MVFSPQEVMKNIVYRIKAKGYPMKLGRDAGQFSFLLNSEIKDVTGESNRCLKATDNMRLSDFVEQLLNTASLTELGDVCSSIRYHYGFDFYGIFARFNRLNQKPLCFVMREFEDDWTG